MSGPKHLSFIRNHTGILLFASFLIGGIVCIFLSNMIKHPLGHEIVRDIGIGFMVAGLVGGIYDLHARSRFDIETMSGVLGAIMGDLVRGDVWNEIKERILNKDWIREPLTIEISLRAAPERDLPPGTMVLWVRMTYDVCNLKSSRRLAKVSHRLDYHHSYGNLPQFKSIRIGGDTVPQAVLEAINSKNGVFDQDVQLEPRDRKPVRVRVEREELVYVPGSYNLVMSVIAKNIRVFLHDIAPDFNALVNIRPHKDNPLPLTPNDEMKDELEDVLFLPGQVMEFIFVRQLSHSNADPEHAGGRNS